MPRILVTNPDPDVQQAVLSLLNANFDYDAEPCYSAGQSLDALHAGEFELVIADMALACADGHTFLRALLAADAHRPVLLTGSEGTVDQVVAALRAGAVGFVHTDKLDSDLTENITHVLSAAHRNKVHARVLDCMTQSVSTFEIDNDPLLLPALLTRFQSSAAMFGVCAEAGCTRLGIALEEALSNALYHGNLEVSSELRRESLEGYYELAGERRSQPPYCNRKIRVTETLTADAAVFTICDDGPGFDTAKLNAQPDTQDLEAVSGRGIPLMNAFMDEVTFNAQGNQVTLVKRKASSDDGLTLAA